MGRNLAPPGEFSGQWGLIGTAFALCNFFEADTQVVYFPGSLRFTGICRLGAVFVGWGGRGWVWVRAPKKLKKKLDNLLFPKPRRCLTGFIQEGLNWSEMAETQVPRPRRRLTGFMQEGLKWSEMAQTRVPRPRRRLRGFIQKGLKWLGQPPGRSGLIRSSPVTDDKYGVLWRTEITKSQLSLPLFLIRIMGGHRAGRCMGGR